MTMSTFAPVGSVITITKQISDADVALFTLVATDEPPAPEEPGAPEPQGPAAVPGALVAALLCATAAGHANGLSAATVARAEIACLAPTHTEDTLTVVAEVLAADPAAGTLRVRATCANQSGTPIAEGTFDLRTNG